MLPRWQTEPQTPSSSEDTLPSPHTTYWGYLSQAHTHLRGFSNSWLASIRVDRHGDVISEVGDTSLAEIGVKHVQRAKFINFTLLPRLVEVCVAPSDEIPMYPFRIDRLDKATEK
jgi:hypothetical protein